MVRCGGCPGMFHAAVSCLGVEQSAVKALLEVKSGALKYFCCNCRQKDHLPGSEGTSLGNQAAIQQILTMIGSLVADFSILADKVNKQSGNVQRRYDGD